MLLRLLLLVCLLGETGPSFIPSLSAQPPIRVEVEDERLRRSEVWTFDDRGQLLSKEYEGGRTDFQPEGLPAGTDRVIYARLRPDGELTEVLRRVVTVSSDSLVISWLTGNGRVPKERRTYLLDGQGRPTAQLYRQRGGPTGDETLAEYRYDWIKPGKARISVNDRKADDVVVNRNAKRITVITTEDRALRSTTYGLRDDGSIKNIRLDAQNGASSRMQLLGFNREGVIKRASSQSGEAIPTVLWSVTNHRELSALPEPVIHRLSRELIYQKLMDGETYEQFFPRSLERATTD